MYEQLSLFDYKPIEIEIALMSYIDFKEWLLNKFPKFEEVFDTDKCFKHSGETFRFRYKKGNLTIELNNAFNYKKDGIDWRPIGQYISLSVDRKDSGYGTWVYDLKELEEKLNKEIL